MVGSRQVLLGAIIVGLSGCAATPKSCRGLGQGNVPSAHGERAGISQLQCAADQNIVAAQLQLAKRYETGDGIPRDVARAIALYEKAAAPIPPTTAIYSPPVRLGGRGQMMFLSNPNAGPGSAEAQYRLGLLFLSGRDVTLDQKRGRTLIQRAADQGYPPAIDELDRTGG